MSCFAPKNVNSVSLTQLLVILLKLSLPQVDPIWESLLKEATVKNISFCLLPKTESNGTFTETEKSPSWNLEAWFARKFYLPNYFSCLSTSYGGLKFFIFLAKESISFDLWFKNRYGVFTRFFSFLGTNFEIWKEKSLFKLNASRRQCLAWHFAFQMKIQSVFEAR